MSLAVSGLITPDTELFIDSIKKRPALYMTSHKDYNDTECKKRLWIEVCNEVVSGWPKLDINSKNLLVLTITRTFQESLEELKDRINTFNTSKLPPVMIAAPNPARDVPKLRLFRMMKEITHDTNELFQRVHTIGIRYQSLYEYQIGFAMSDAIDKYKQIIIIFKSTRDSGKSNSDYLVNNLKYMEHVAKELTHLIEMMMEVRLPNITNAVTKPTSIDEVKIIRRNLK